MEKTPEKKINSPSANPTINLALDTLQIKKQALIFVNTKRSAEKTAEDISNALKTKEQKLDELSEKILNALSKPTKQCERLARCVKKGVAFHHSGLAPIQRELIEDAFRDNTIKLISCTPTLAAGVDLPSFRTILKDLKRFGTRGMNWIPVLEYLQMAGRSGRPKYDTFGEAIAVVASECEKQEIHERYILGEPEAIYSKLAVEPVLRTYVLSLIASRFVKDVEGLISFFEKTFWAHQFKDMELLKKHLMKVLMLLEKWDFIEKMQGEFVSADQLEKINATPLGKRVAELYLDPLTAYQLISGLKKAPLIQTLPFSYIQLISNTLEMRPLLRVRNKEENLIDETIAKYTQHLLQAEPSLYDIEYEDFVNSIKTALFFSDWIDEKDEEFLLETYDVRPGEIRIKLDLANWLLYAITELSKLIELQKLIKDIVKTRTRIKYGIKEELLALVKLKNIGRVRARILFRNGIKDIGDIKKADITTLTHLLGKSTAISAKAQVDINKKDEEQEKLQ